MCLAGGPSTSSSAGPESARRGKDSRMAAPRTAPYGAWKSPITSDLIATATVSLDQVALDFGDVYWVEGRPAEGGRCVVVRRTSDGETSDVTPAPFNVRTRAHEYGGGAYTVDRGTVY